MSTIKKWGKGLRERLARVNRRLHASDGLAWLLAWLGKILFTLLILGFLLFEEVWEALHDWLIRPRFYHRAMTAINGFCARHNRVVVLLVYLSLFIPMEILGLASAALVASGHPVWAVLVYVSKGLIAIPAIDIFVANAEKLRSFVLIDWGYGKLQQLKSSQIYRLLVDRIGRLKRRLQAALQWKA